MKHLDFESGKPFGEDDAVHKETLKHTSFPLVFPTLQVLFLFDTVLLHLLSVSVM